MFSLTRHGGSLLSSDSYLQMKNISISIGEWSIIRRNFTEAKGDDDDK